MATSLVAELAEKLSSATNNLDFDEQTLFLNTSADTVGIGTDSPASKLDVRGTFQVGVNDTGYDVTFFADAAGAYMLWDTSNEQLQLRGPAGSYGKLLISTAEPSIVDGNKLGQIDFQAPLENTGGTTGDQRLVAASIWAEAETTFSNVVNQTSLVFATAQSETAVEKMRLDEEGNLGIGTVSPASLLHVDGTVQVGVDNTGYDVKFFGATASKYWLWDESADTMILVGSSNMTGSCALDGSLNVGGNTNGHDVKFFGNTTLAYMLWDESADTLIVKGGYATPGKITLQTAESDVVDGNKFGQIDFQAPDDNAGGDALYVGASIWAEADATFSSSVNATELVFATGASEVAAEKMRLTSDGNIGIGTTAPNILSASGTTVSIVGSSQTGVLELVNTSTGGTNSLGSIEFLNLAGGSSAAARAIITASRDGADDACNMRFFTEATGGSVTERMRIGSDGKIGIDNTSPGAMLHISERTDSDSTQTVLKLSRARSGGNFTDDSGGAIVFSLHDASQINADVAKITWAEQGGGGDNDDYLAFHTLDGGSMTETMRITDSQVGIGTTVPDERLHVMESEVSGATGHSESSIVAERNGNSFICVLGSSNSGILFGDAGNSEIGRINYNHGSNYMNFYTNNTERMRIDSSGNVIVGSLETGKPQLYNVADSAASPAFGFYNDAGLGMYRISGDTLGFTVGGTKRMTMASDGSIGAPSGTNIYNPSDSRLKQNVSSLSGCLAKIKQLKGVSFNWIDGFAVDEKDRTLYGLVAQDAQAVDSNLIEDYGNGLLTIEGVTIDNPLRVNEKFIIPMLIEAMKELSAKVTALENA